MKLTQNNLLQFLNRKNFEPLFQKETDQIYFLMKILNQDVPVFFSIRSENQLLQILAYLPFELHQSTIADVGRLLHLLNRELDMPGFGMDEFKKIMFYRSAIPCLDQECDEKSLEVYLVTTRIACETFMEAIAAIASGSMRFDDVLKESNKRS